MIIAGASEEVAKQFAAALDRASKNIPDWDAKPEDRKDMTHFYNKALIADKVLHKPKDGAWDFAAVKLSLSRIPP